MTPDPDTTAGEQRWRVQLAQQYPGAPETTLRQSVTTRTESGRTLITTITTITTP